MAELISVLKQNKHSNPTKTSRLGQLGEELAVGFLVENGYRPVIANFRVPIGRNSRGAIVTGEIDLIAFDSEVLCFIEVKTRSSADFATPESAVDLRKQRQITRTARVYRKIFRLGKFRFRYDVVSIVLNGKREPKIEVFKGFWSEAKFRRKFRRDDL